MKNRDNKSYIEGLLVLVLFGIFAICILMVLLTGAGAYRRLVERQQEAYADRTVPQYIATKVRQADEAGAVCIGDFCGVESLELRETYDKDEYITRIYCYDGSLRELFSDVSSDFKPEDGEKILEAEQVDFILEGNCLQISVTIANGEKIESKLTLRSTKGGAKK